MKVAEKPSVLEVVQLAADAFVPQLSRDVKLPTHAEELGGSQL